MVVAVADATFFIDDAIHDVRRREALGQTELLSDNPLTDLLRENHAKAMDVIGSEAIRDAVDETGSSRRTIERFTHDLAVRPK